MANFTIDNPQFDVKFELGPVRKTAGEMFNAEELLSVCNVRLGVRSVELDLPERNPLDSKALSLDDIRPGVAVRICSVEGINKYMHGIATGETYVIDSDPYVSVYGGDGIDFSSRLVVKLAAQDSQEGRRPEVVPLNDIGIIPHDMYTSAYWDEYVYTLQA